jgi:hypothetical protein
MKKLAVKETKRAPHRWQDAPTALGMLYGLCETVWWECVVSCTQ